MASSSPARTPGGRRILAASGSDSPLPPLVEVAADRSPTAVPLVSPEDLGTQGGLVAESADERDGGLLMQLDSEADNSQLAHNRHTSLMDVDVDDSDSEHDSSGSSGSPDSDKHSTDSDSSSSSSSSSDTDGEKSSEHGEASDTFGQVRLFELGLGGISRMANAQRFRPLLSTLNDAVDETQQLVALQELAELLSMATEESLIGVDIGDFARVLINLGGGPSGDLAGLVAGNANVMLLACRCLSNLLEALPLSGSTLLRHGAVDMLCGRLLDIEYIDVAEQALSVLARISRDFAARVCEAGGLSACLMFLDFFASSTQHTALTCAVNCARAISSDQFAQAADAVPVLERTMFYSDPKTVELSCAALLHLVTAFRSSPERTERLVSADLLQRIVTSFRSGDSMHHDEASVALLRLLVVVATASRERAAQLLGMAIIPTVCDILSAQCVDPHVAFGAVDEARNTRQYRQRSAVRVPEPAWEALRLVLALLPRLPITSESLGHMEVFVRQGNGNGDDDALSDDCCLRLHAVYTSAGALDQLQNALLPLMVRVIASTINVSARYRAMLVILKVVLCLGSDQLRAALSTIDLPQFVVATLSLQSSLLLSVISLLTTRLVLDKLPGHYTRRFIREGVVDGLSRIVAAAESLLAAIAAGRRDSTDSEPTEENSGDDDNDDSINAPDSSNNTMDGDAEPLTLSAGFRLIDVHIPNTARHGTVSASQMPLFMGISDSSGSATRREVGGLVRYALAQARLLQQRLDASHESAGDYGRSLHQLQEIANHLETAGDSTETVHSAMESLAVNLLSPDGVTCHELMQSGLVNALVSAFARTARTKQIEMATALVGHHSPAEPFALSTSAFGVLVLRLQEALGLVERLSVNEAYRAGSDEHRSPAHMLSKQIRFSVKPAANRDVTDNVLAEQMEQVRQGFQPIRVSVHAVSTFSVLEAYLRPRIALLTRSSRQRRQLRRGLEDPEASASGTSADESHASSSRPQQVRLGRLAGTATSEGSDISGEGGIKRDSEHLRMLRMIAQASGIDLRAAGLFEGLDVDAADDQSVSGSENDDDEQTIGEPSGQDGVSTTGAAAPGRPGNWHLAFILCVDGVERTVGAADNIFRVIYELCQGSPAFRGTNPWTQSFDLRFYMAPGSGARAASENSQSDRLLASLRDADASTRLDTSIGEPAAAMVHLLQILHGLVAPVREHMQEMDMADIDSLFVNHKVTAKTARQLEDPLMVVCSALPDWCYQLVSSAPFLISFETRLAFLQAACFGYSRNINYWQAMARRERRDTGRASDDLQIPLGHMQRQKVRISRHRMLESALKMLDLYGTPKTILEVEYYDEVGSGIGPTLEFYATISRCLQERELGLWRDERSPALEPSDEYVYASHGLFPAPLDPNRDSGCAQDAEPADALPPNDRVIQLFKFTGHLVAKGLIDGRILDIPLSAGFWTAVQRQLTPTGEPFAWSWDQLEAVDAQLAKSLRYLRQFVEAKHALYARKELTSTQLQSEMDSIRHPSDQASVADLTLDFTLPGYPDVELRQGGAEIPVTIANIHLYIDLVAEWTLHAGIRAQTAAFCQGFDRVFPSTSLLMFTPAELCSLVGQTAADDTYWSEAAVQAGIRLEHGFTPSSPEVHMFVEFLGSLDRKERRMFLQFVTGAPRLPLGGFQALHPPLHLVPRPATPPLQPDDYLPSVMTCMNLVKLPKYSSSEIFAQRWRQVMAEGQCSFHLS